MTVDVLNHHHGIVDDHAGCQHQCQQGENIDRKSEQPDRSNGADQRHRDRSRRDQRRAQRTHKGIDHREHDKDGNGKTGEHFAHRSLDKGRVVRNFDDTRVIEPPVEFCDRLVDPVRYGNSVRLRAADNAQPDDLAAIEQAVAFGLRRAVIGAGNVAEPNIGFEFQRLNLDRPPDRGISAHQKQLIVGFEATDGHVEVGGAQRAGDIVNRQAETGEPHGFDHDAQHRFLIAE